MRYIAKREGLDVINIPNHEDLALREPFMVWADGKGIILDPKISASQVDMSFQGFPDPRGRFKSDLADAPVLQDWLVDDANKVALQETLDDLFSCQKAEVLGKLLGWYTASIYRMIFHKAYGKFPVLHVNGPAGSGKTEMNKALMSLFFFHQEPKLLTPGSTLFAVQQHMASSASIPLLLDEYKPSDMSIELHAKYRLMIRDSYNCRDMSKGGGTRESDDYRSLHETQLAAPLVVIAEAAEEEAAVSERVVLVTMVKPASSVSTMWAMRYHRWSRNSKHLTILGKWLVAQAIHTSSVENLCKEFDPLYQAARENYMLNAADLKRNLPAEVLSSKQNAKERSVYNFTVARYGFMKFRFLVESIYGQAFKEKLDEMDAGIYTRMSDLQSSTQAEWAKVISLMSTMSHHVKAEADYSLRQGFDYAFVDVGGRDCIEIALRNAYLRYRAYCRQAGGIKPLFQGDQSFLQAIKDSSALVDTGLGRNLHVPGIYTFDVAELSRLGVGEFKS
jgi:hypothetical protein